MSGSQLALVSHSATAGKGFAGSIEPRRCYAGGILDGLPEYIVFVTTCVHKTVDKRQTPKNGRTRSTIACRTPTRWPLFLPPHRKLQPSFTAQHRGPFTAHSFLEFSQQLAKQPGAHGSVWPTGHFYAPVCRAAAPCFCCSHPCPNDRRISARTAYLPIPGMQYTHCSVAAPPTPSSVANASLCVPCTAGRIAQLWT